jgi:hypothetical protein
LPVLVAREKEEVLSNLRQNFLKRRARFANGGHGDFEPLGGAKEKPTEGVEGKSFDHRLN